SGSGHPRIPEAPDAGEQVMHSDTPPVKDLAGLDELPTPALVLFPEVIDANIQTVLRLAGGPERLRPHVKTHKMAEIVRRQCDAGITKHKCATIAEAEMLAEVGVPDVLIAYPLIGPNVRRFFQLQSYYPNTLFSVLVDHRIGVAQLSAGAREQGTLADVVVDINAGMNRTGILLKDALEFCRTVAAAPGLRFAGLQAYDGQNHQQDAQERTAAVNSFLPGLLQLRSDLLAAGIAVPRLILGGTPTFPQYAPRTDIPGLECSPGTYILHDAGYGGKFEDLAAFRCAAVAVTRVVSRPTPNRITLDLGTKSLATDPPLANRARFLNLPEASIVGHNEEHMVVESPRAEDFLPGDVLFALPGHICPTVALHRDVAIAMNGRIAGRWTVSARDRRLTI
ncbi:MAG: D-TA family PLP-dependent enzyme, partial [Gemmataceae bacterium]